MSEYRQTLLTGFDAFGRVVSNPSARLLKRFAGQVIGDQLITTCLLPVSYSHAPIYMEMALRAGGKNGTPFENVFMLGVADNETKWRVERVGRNANGSVPDIEGSVHENLISREAPAELISTLPVKELVLALEAVGLPVCESQSAGDYLCNFIFFHTLWNLQLQGSETKVGFLHIPADVQTFAESDLNEKAFSLEDHALAIEAVLTVMALEFDPNADTSFTTERVEFLID